tara:strand:+ start:544 stop:717 length:174 start_codon:yes stop_codon:yes gene_type:complete
MTNMRSQNGKMGRAYGHVAITHVVYIRRPTKEGRINQIMGMVVTVSSSALESPLGST